LVLDALNMALATRRPREVTHRSDQGSQHTSIECGRRCHDARMRPAMGPVADAHNNATCERFFATFECKLLDRCRGQDTGRSAQHAVFEFIEDFYNPRHRHCSIGYLSPEQVRASASRPGSQSDGRPGGRPHGVLDVTRPDPVSAITELNDYVFERAVRDPDIDFYKRGRFVPKARQSRPEGGRKKVLGHRSVRVRGTAEARRHARRRLRPRAPDPRRRRTTRHRLPPTWPCSPLLRCWTPEGRRSPRSAAADGPGHHPDAART
jgi:hypothetical protein